MIHTLQNGKFAILKILGQGGFGITYEASNSMLGKRVAIKELFLDNICIRGNDGTTVTVTSEEKRNLFKGQKDRFIQEAGKLARLSHPHIVAVHDLFEENGTAYYVMDYIEGESLADYLEHTRQPMNEDDVLNILDQVLDALAYLHAREPPLLHLDIKPANLIRKEDGNVVLIDFGASKNMPQDDRKLSTTLAYTPRFAPQEQADHDMDNIGPWTDFYSLGATLYNLLTNKRPPNTTELLKDQTEDKHIALPFPVSVSTPMRHLVRQLMSIDQTKRPQSVEEIHKILHEKDEPGQEKSEVTLPINDKKDHKSIRDPKQEHNPKPVIKKKISTTLMRIIILLAVIAFVVILFINILRRIPTNDDSIEKMQKKATEDNVLCPDGNHPHAIDLGLPSGTKWACCNVGADKPEGYGGYYAWGETETKTTYDWSTYKHCDGTEESCRNIGNDIAGTQYDVAHVKWGGSWVMPSLDQVIELSNNCTSKWITNNGINGIRFKSKKNGGSIFLPSAGFFWYGDNRLLGADSYGDYWLSTQHPSCSDQAYSLNFSFEGDNPTIPWLDRLGGFSVRPVSR